MLSTYTKKLVQKKDLTRTETYEAFDMMMTKNMEDVKIASFLSALRTKGETLSELVGGAEFLRNHASKIESLKNGIDTCGTGGDGFDTFNISTISALVLASLDLPVYKHGNKSVSGKCGSADVLEKSGVLLNLSTEQIARGIEETGFGFFFAPLFHPVMKKVAPVRKALGMPTIFNMLGPLVNPAGVKVQVLGVYHPSLTELFANALKELGAEKALVFSSEEGLDEISPFSKTVISELRNGQIQTYTVDSTDFGAEEISFEELKVRQGETNEGILENVLKGEDVPRKSVVAMNAGAALYISGKANSLKEGYHNAQMAMLKGKAYDTFVKYRDYTRECSK